MDPNEQAKGKEGTGKIATAKNATVGVTYDAVVQENFELTEKVRVLTERITLAEDQLAEANKILESEVREEKIKRIMGKSNYTRAELEEQYPPGVDESLKSLQKLDESLSRGLGSASVGKTGTFKPVSSAKDSLTVGTMPDLFNKTRAEVLKDLSEM
jgi:hypothetical protein